MRPQRARLYRGALFVKNLSYNVTPEDLFDLFGKFGPIRQVRQGIANNTKGTAFVVYEDVLDAKSACDKLNGFNFQSRYLVGRSPTSRKSKTPDPKTILRKDRQPTETSSTHHRARAVRFADPAMRPQMQAVA
ncbi:Splicing factor 3B subunit-like protein [Emericellopsis cladophorae]|uniref:Splicing factor 3B subunit-like protein n=1 Tax=Emericellopsis cladophorae TaxID=2686198 RepID=A0A9Q0BFB7_9HYPO|nr:Splicing factor 3B subunit-like protein [Emericellopsis cladophorae]KAI6783812.1 Splicing factor 3B subunit-like protein [Emericellopsis cladophorae]